MPQPEMIDGVAHIRVPLCNDRDGRSVIFEAAQWPNVRRAFGGRLHIRIGSLSGDAVVIGRQEPRGDKATIATPIARAITGAEPHEVVSSITGDPCDLRAGSWQVLDTITGAVRRCESFSHSGDRHYRPAKPFVPATPLEARAAAL